MSRPGSTGLRFGMFAVCVARDPDPGLNSGKAKPLYDLLVTFADVSSRDTGQGYPYRAALADCLDCSKQTVDRAAEYLEKEIGLVRVVRRKVEGKEDENDANLYMIFDAWLIHGVLPPAHTPPQLVARYGHTIPGFDIDVWMQEHAPDFDLTGWQAAHDEKLRAQQAKREEQRRKERARRKKSKRGGGVVTGEATPEHLANEGGDVMDDASGRVTGYASSDVVGDALSKAGDREPSSTPTDGGSAVGQSAGGLAPAGASCSAAPKADSEQGDSAADPKDSPPRQQKRNAPRTTKLTPARPVAGEEEVWAALGPVLAEVGMRQGTRPATLQKAVRLLLGHNTDARSTAFDAYPRSPEHALARINRGWYRAQGPERAAKDYDGPDAIRRPVGYLVTVLTAQECIRPDCELGVLLTTGKECGECMGRAIEREAARLAARLEEETAELAAERQAREATEQQDRQDQRDAFGLPEQRATWRCETPTCRRLGRGTPPDVPLCPECIEDARLSLHQGAPPF
ncbi:hypothetical protein [Streptomyces sp. KHY 26]|uniref:hypothetical protein n=1 Tax=Streptomyces sp. KHY 26 TaxID=3097359 RepID=UPI00376EE6BA